MPIFGSSQQGQTESTLTEDKDSRQWGSCLLHPVRTRELKADMLTTAGKRLAGSLKTNCKKRIFTVWLSTVLPQGWGPVKCRRSDSGKARSPMTTVELSARHGTSGMSIRAGPDHSCVAIRSCAKIVAAMIESSGAAVCSSTSTPAARRTPLPHLCAHLTHHATIAMGANAMHHLPDEVRANRPNPGFATHVRESLTHQCHGTSGHWSCCSPVARKVAQESNKKSSRTSAHARQQLHVLTAAKRP